MYFKQVRIGGYDNNLSYFIGDDVSKEVVIIDPDNIPLLKEIIEKDDLLISGILLTHGHFDHTAGAEAMHNLTGSPIYLHAKNPKARELNVASVRYTTHGDEIDAGGIKIIAIETPGHTPESLCFYVEGKLITGDTLFIGGCGRCDLPGGDTRQMYNSLYNIIGKLSADTVIYPGHDYGEVPFDTLKHQKEVNKYLLCKSEVEFVNLRDF